MSTFSATLTAADAGDAIERVARRLPDGFAVTGRSSVRSERHLLRTVEVENRGGDVDDCFVVLTSYRISPSVELGSTWESTLGASA